MVCNATCTGTVVGSGGVGKVVGWRGLRQYDSGSGISVGQYHGGEGQFNHVQYLHV